MDPTSDKPAASPPAQTERKESPLRRTPAALLLLNMGFFSLVAVLCFYLVTKAVGGPYLTILNGIHSWEALGGFPGLFQGLGLGAILIALAGVGWFSGIVAKAISDELKNRIGF